MKKVICSKCKKFVDYNIEYKQVTYLKAEAHCKECGANVWVEEVEEQNILASTLGAMLASDTQKVHKEGYKKDFNSKLASDFVVVAQKIAVEKFAKKLKKVIHKRDYIQGYAEIGLIEEIDELLKEYEND